MVRVYADKEYREATHNNSVKAALVSQPYLSIKCLSQWLRAKRTFMAKAQAVLEECAGISPHQVGPARIYSNVEGSEGHVQRQ